MVEIVTGICNDADTDSLGRVAGIVSRAVNSSTYGAAQFVALEVVNLTHRDLGHIPIVFHFTSWLAREWAHIGMVAGAMNRFAGGCVPRTYFILPYDEEERLVRLSDFIAEAEARRMLWAATLRMSPDSSWDKICAHARVMWRRRKRCKEMLASLFVEKFRYGMDHNWQM